MDESMFTGTIYFGCVEIFLKANKRIGFNLYQLTYIFSTVMHRSKVIYVFIFMNVSLQTEFLSEALIESLNHLRFQMTPDIQPLREILLNETKCN